MGDMGELGEDEAAAMHAEVGAYARDKGIEAAYFVGDNSVEAAETFGAEGLWFADKDPLIQVLSHDLPERATVLVKGSRFMKMEEVVEALTDKEVSENGQKRKRPILLQFIVLMLIVAAVLWPAVVWLYIENVGFETISEAYEGHKRTLGLV